MSDLNERCCAIADQVVPEYRTRIGQNFSCGSHTAKRWEAAYDAASLVYRPFVGPSEAWEKIRAVPQAWIDRAMQIEATADGLVSYVNAAIQRAQEGSGRLYASNIVQLDGGVMQLLEAINLPEPALGDVFEATHTSSVREAEVERLARLVYEDHPFHPISPALQELTGLRPDEAIAYEQFLALGGRDDAAKRVIRVVLAALHLVTGSRATPGQG